MKTTKTAISWLCLVIVCAFADPSIRAQHQIVDSSKSQDIMLASAVESSHLELLKPHEIELEFAGPLAFGPDGVLFVGDSKAKCVYALDTMDREPGEFPNVKMEGIDVSIAEALGVDRRKIRITDMAVNPISGTPYLSVSRGRGSSATPMILKIAADGEISELNLTDIRSSKTKLADDNADGDDEKESQRMVMLTDVAFLDDKIVVSGLSNEEFSSQLRVITYPFEDATANVALEIMHGSHDVWETNAPVRTSCGIKIDGGQYLMAAYTCTPLVRFSLADLTSSEKVRGATVAELGAFNSPVDMFSYEKDGKQFILVSNTAYGLLKVSTDELASKGGFTAYAGDNEGGQTFEAIEGFDKTLQLAKYGEESALVMIRNLEDKRIDLIDIVLP